MRRTFLFALLAALLFTAAAATAQDMDLNSLPSDLRDRVEDLLATRFPPDLHSVTLEPEFPAEGDEVTITAEVYNDPDLSSDETSEVYVLFSSDGMETWDYIELETDDDKEWYGTFPAFESGDQVVYAVYAVDTSSNVYTDVPCSLDESGQILGDTESDEFRSYVDEDCINSDGAEACEDFLPRGCMFRMSVDDDLDDDESEIPNHFDLLDYRFGYNEDKLYLDIAFEDKLSKNGGTTSPMDIHIYVAALLNVDITGDGTDLNAVLEGGGILLHAPAAEIAGGMILPCMYGYSKGGDFAQDGDSVECILGKNHLVFEVDQSIFEDGLPENGIQFFAANGTITSIEPVAGTVYDNSHVTHVKFKPDNYFDVE